jgi:AcrR family transcriptional regulator
MGSPRGRQPAPRRAPLGGRTLRETARRGPGRQEAILRAALRLFGQRGYDETTVEEIAREAGVAKGLLYHYFRSKEEVLERVLLAGFEILEDAMAAARSVADPRGRLERLLEDFAELLRREAGFFRLYTSLLIRLPSRPHLRRLVVQASEGLLGELQELLEALGIRNPRTEAYRLGALLDGIAVDYLVMGDAYPLEEVLRSVAADLLEAGRKWEGT